MRKSSFLLICLISLFAKVALGQTVIYTVTTTSDNGYFPAPTNGQLAFALQAAQAAPAGNTKIIRFDFTALGSNPSFTLSGPFFDQSTGIIGNNIFLDGETGKPVGGSVTFNGSIAYNGLLSFKGNNNTVAGISFNSGSTAAACLIFESGSSNLSLRNKMQNGLYGIYFKAGSSNQSIGDFVQGSQNAGIRFESGANNISVINSSVTGVNRNGIDIYNGNNILISNSSIFNNGITGTYQTSEGIFLVSPSSNVTISGCSIYNNAGNGIYDANINNLLIQGNYIYGNGRSLNNTSEVSGIRIENSSVGIRIIGNTIGTNSSNSPNLGNGFDGITLYSPNSNSASNTLISNNILVDNGKVNQINSAGGGIAIRNGSGNNTITGNIFGRDASLSPNGNKGYGFSLESSSSNLVRGNSFFATSGPGLNISANSNGGSNSNIVIGNILGNPISSVSSFANQGGISIQYASTNNTIGTLLSPNTIANNTNFGIQVDGSNGVTTGNRILANSIFCNNNTKGIALIGNGNNNYASGGTTPPNLYINNLDATPGQISGVSPANAIIDVYIQSPCESCGSSPATNYAQGRTWVGSTSANGSGAWTYTLSGLATKTNTVVTATDASNNTSEFSACYGVVTCTAPSAFTVNTSNVICASGSNIATLTISGAQSGVSVTYAPRLNGGATISGSVVTTTLSSFNMTVPGLSVGANSISVLAFNACGTASSSLVTVTVNSAPTLTAATGFINCGTPFSTVSLSGVASGRTYSAYILGSFVTSSVAGSSNLNLSISTTNLAIGSNTISITGFVAGCGTVGFGTVSGVRNPIITPPTGLTGPSLICTNASATLTLTGAVLGVTYFPVIGGVNGTPVVATSTSINLSSGILSATSTVSVIASIAGCGITNLATSFIVNVRPTPNTGLSVLGNTICQGSLGTVTVFGTQLGIDYSALVNGTTTSLVAGTGGNLNLSIPANYLNVGINIVSVSGTGCFTGILNNTATVVVNSTNLSAVSISGPSSLCGNTNGIFTTPTVSGATGYAWFVNGSPISGTSFTNTITGLTSDFIVQVAPTNILCGIGGLRSLTVSAINTPTTTATIAGPSTLCANNTATYSISTVTGATGYFWNVPAGATINSGQNSNSISVTLGSTSGNVSVQPFNSCGTSTSINLLVTITTAPGATGTISASTTSICSGLGSSGTFSIPSLPNVTTYTWSVPSDATITSGQGTTSIGVNFGSLGGIISVLPINACGTGTGSNISINAISAPSAAGTISSNLVNYCASSTGIFTISTVAGATGYTWTLPADAQITSGANTNSITVLLGNTSGTISVTPTNACTTGASASFNLNIEPVPAISSIISGPNPICAGSSPTYSITGISNATVNWSVASLAGSSIVSGQGTNVLNLNVGNTSGTLSVSATGVCGTSSVTSLAITVNSLPSAFTITSTGNKTEFCQNTVETTIGASNSTGAASYVWSFSPSGAASTTDITANPSITFGSTPGEVVITAKAINSCGTTTSTLFVNVSSAPGLSQGIVAPSIDLCASNFNSPSGYVFSIPTVAGSNVTYNWSVSQGTFTQISASNPSITLSLPTGASGNVTANVTVLGLGCGTPSTTTSVAITGLPDISNIGIVGPTNTCAGTYTYSIPSGGGATDYIWFNGSSSNSISVTLTASGTISVIPQGICGTGTGTNLPVAINTVPSVGSISGPAGICYDPTLSAPNATTFTASSAGATGYQWAISTGSSIASGQGTSSVGIIFGKLSATITVTASNLCGNSLPFSTSAAIEVDTISTLSVTTVLGSSLICNSAKSKTFTVTPLAGAFGYTWSYPSTMTVLSAFAPNTLTSPVIGNSITADFSGASLTLTVSAFGKYCSTSKLAYKDIFVAGIISTLPGATTSCLNSDQEFSIATLPGISAYDWQVSNGTYTVTSTAPNSSIKATFTITGAGSVKVSPIADEVCTVGSFTLSNTIQDNLGNDQALFGPNILCQNATVDYTTTVTGTTFFTWEIPSDAMIITSNLGGNFVRIKFGTIAGFVKATPNTVCFASTILPKEITVQVLTYPVAHAGGSLINATDLIKTYPTVLDETPITLNGTVSSQTSTGNTFPQYTYTWTAQPAADITGKNSLTPVISPNERETKVYVLVDNGYCYSIDSALVKLDIDYIPKAFSPNEDGANDTWQIDNLYTYKNFKMTVYNKWGSPVKEFSSYDKDKTRMWDGTSNGVALPAAVYYYVIDFNNENGKQPRKGSVTIVR